MEDVKRILVLSRSTNHCQKAVHYGISLAKALGAELFVVHNVHNFFGAEGWNIPLPSLSDLHNQYQKMQTEVRKELDAMIEKEAAAGLPIEVDIIEGEFVKDALKMVKEKNIDLIITRAHQEGWLEHALFGRDNEKLIRELPCSIILVKDEGLSMGD